MGWGVAEEMKTRNYYFAGDSVVVVWCGPSFLVDGTTTVHLCMALSIVHYDTRC